MRHRTPTARTHRLPSLWVDLTETLILPGAIIYVLLAANVVFGPSAHGQDFGVFYRSAVAWRSGNDLYAGPATASRNLNPPVFTVLISPLAQFPLRQGLILWWAINIGALGIALTIIARELSVRPSPRMILVGIFFAGTQAQLLLSQVAWVCMLLATLSWRAWRREQAVRAGLWLGVLIGLKPLFLPVLAVALLRRKWPLALAAVGLVVLTVLVGALACGWSAYGSWLQAGRSVASFGAFLNASVRGVLARLADDSVARPLWILASLLAAGVAVWQLGRHPSSPDRDLAVGFLTSLLISPLGWVYYLPVALGPLLVTLRGLQCRWWTLLGLAGLFWPPGVGWVSPEKQLERVPRNALMGSLYAIGLLTLWWISLRERRVPTRPSGANQETTT